MCRESNRIAFGTCFTPFNTCMRIIGIELDPNIDTLPRKWTLCIRAFGLFMFLVTVSSNVSYCVKSFRNFGNTPPDNSTDQVLIEFSPEFWGAIINYCSYNILIMGSHFYLLIMSRPTIDWKKLWTHLQILAESSNEYDEFYLKFRRAFFIGALILAGVNETIHYQHNWIRT